MTYNFYVITGFQTQVQEDKFGQGQLQGLGLAMRRFLLMRIDAHH